MTDYASDESYQNPLAGFTFVDPKMTMPLLRTKDTKLITESVSTAMVTVWKDSNGNPAPKEIASPGNLSPNHYSSVEPIAMCAGHYDAGYTQTTHHLPTRSKLKTHQS